MQWADAGVLLLPCGRSAHLEAGYFVGSGKPLFVLLADGEPELMYRMATRLCVNLFELIDAIPTGAMR
jgi:nucleoside 2-deoxyribosyltransferase